MRTYSPGAAQAAANQTPPGTIQDAVEQTHADTYTFTEQTDIEEARPGAAQGEELATSIILERDIKKPDKTSKKYQI